MTTLSEFTSKWKAETRTGLPAVFYGMATRRVMDKTMPVVMGAVGTGSLSPRSEVFTWWPIAWHADTGMAVAVTVPEALKRITTACDLNLRATTPPRGRMLTLNELFTRYEDVKVTRYGDCLSHGDWESVIPLKALKLFDGREFVLPDNVTSGRSQKFRLDGLSVYPFMWERIDGD